MSYFAHRVLSWPDGEKYVEVVEGRDSADPGMMATKYKHLHEGWEFDDPREAAIAGVRIRRQWEKDSGEEIGIAYNGKMAGEFGVPAEQGSERDVLLWAKKKYDDLPKCDRCLAPIIGTAYRLIEYDYGDRFCSESCADSAYWELFNDEEE